MSAPNITTIEVRLQVLVELLAQDASIESQIEALRDILAQVRYDHRGVAIETCARVVVALYDKGVSTNAIAREIQNTLNPRETRKRNVMPARDVTANPLIMASAESVKGAAKRTPTKRSK